eukprot:GHVU01212912.1.p1 GENE.GHVU01212912.1~~GHVU01212912.1.p1  ORF type:complete len:441 (+),score=38.96 GHVU01212912.1:70-1392(+)
MIWCTFDYLCSTYLSTFVAVFTSEQLVECVRRKGNPVGHVSRVVCAVTGANSGIGKVVAKECARMGATVVLICINKHRGEAAIRDIAREVLASNKNWQQQRQHEGKTIKKNTEEKSRGEGGTVDDTGGDISTLAERLHLVVCDLMDVSACVNAAAELRRRFKRLDILFNNAGVISGTGNFRWKQGLGILSSRQRLSHFMRAGRSDPKGPPFIKQRRTMHPETQLSHCILTHNVGHQILVSELETWLNTSHTRVVWVGSSSATSVGLVWAAHPKTDEFPWPDVNTDDEYGVSKFINDVQSDCLSDRWLYNSNARSYLVCPGVCNTGISPAIMQLLRPVAGILGMVYPFFKFRASRGADAVLRVGIDVDGICGSRGKYVVEANRVILATEGYCAPSPSTKNSFNRFFELFKRRYLPPDAANPSSSSHEIPGTLRLLRRRRRR